MFGIKHLRLDGKPVEFRGKKGTGKTSVIDAITLALTNRASRDYVIKQGAREGEILIETDNGIAINRKKRTDTSDFDKITQYGKAVPKQQTFVNEIFTPLQLNPVAFSSWDKNTQNRAILDLIEFDWDIDWIRQQFGELPGNVDYSQHILQVLEDIQSKKGDYWLRREDANRREYYKRQSSEEIACKLPQGYSAEQWEHYPLAEKIAELQQAQKNNNDIDRAIAFIEAYNNKVRGLQAERDIQVSSAGQAISAEREGLMATIERLKAELVAAENTLSTLDIKLEDKRKIAEAEYNEAIARLDRDVQVAKEYEGKEKRETEGLQAEIANATQMVIYISEYRLFRSMLSECEALKAESAQLTEKIELARKLPGIVLETASIPIVGLTVKDGIPLINGLPISNLSNGERIELCVDITIAKPNGLQIILIDGAEALDDDSRDRLYAKCRDKGLQVIATRTTNDNEFTIVELDSGEITVPVGVA